MLRKVVLSTCLLATSLLVLTSTASAQVDTSRNVYFTFSQPVAVPNMTLPAGKYLFRHMGKETGNNIVQISTADGRKLMGTVSTVQTTRTNVSDRVEVRMLESASNTPVAISTWWYPQARQGFAFIYPRDQAARLAKMSTEPVLTTASTASASSSNQNDLVMMNAAGQESAYNANADSGGGIAQRGEIEGAAASNAPTAVAQNDTAVASGPARTRLPRTASTMPLFGLMGAVALSLGLILRATRRGAQ